MTHGLRALEALVRLYQLKEQRAAKLLVQAQHAEALEQQRSDDLEQLQRSYQLQAASRSSGAIDAFRTEQHFLDQVRAIGEQQLDKVATTRAASSKRHEQLLEATVPRIAVATLLARRREALRDLERRRQHREDAAMATQWFTRRQNRQN